MKHRVLIIGGSLAGLTTALRLASHGYQISILDKKPWITPGSFDSEEIFNHSNSKHHDLLHTSDYSDGFPFVLHGFHRATWSLLEELGTLPCLRTEPPFFFEFLHTLHQTVRFRSFPVPSPFHSLLGLLIFQGLPIRDRWRLVNVLEKFWEGFTVPSSDLETHSAESWLATVDQSEQARRAIWDPLCQFFLGDHLAVTSAGSFSKTLVRCFLSKRSSLQILIPSLGDSYLLVKPLQKLLMTKGVFFHQPNTVTQFQFDSHQVTGVKLQDGTILSADRYVSTVPPKTFVTWLPERLLTKFAYFCNLSQLPEIPALIVHLRIAQSGIRSKLLLSTKTFHWMTSRSARLSNHETTTAVSCIATGNSKLLDQPDPIIISKALAVIRETLFPRTLPESLQPIDVRIIRQPQAFLSAKPGISAYRPLQQSPIPNLYLAGAWTDTGLPASRESSILSGNLCAQAITNSD